MALKIGVIFVNLLHITFSLIDPIVHLPNGNILGREEYTQENKSYFAFEGIPYAAPPIGKLRFQPPQPAENWDFLLDTTHVEVACYQISLDVPWTETENCLLLNIYTPNLHFSDDVEGIPVMLFIHGGGFTSGAGALYQPELFVNNDVILVTINYRLGVFGFISTGDEVIPGNNGLKDQLQAIQWTSENIHIFGGDPDKIIIFGESAGAASASYHILNRKEEGLFQGVILESGNFLGSWTLQKNPREAAFGTAAILNSTFETSDDSAALLKFLQSVDAEDLALAGEQANVASVGHPWNNILAKGLVWGPVIEVENADSFLTDKMYQLLKNGEVLAVPILMGFNSEESIFMIQDPEVAKAGMTYIDENLDTVVPDVMNIVDKSNRTAMAISIRDMYTRGEPFADNIGDGMRYASDNAFTRPTIKLAELYSKVADTYFYQFSYDGELGNITVHYDGAESVGHTEEMAYLFCSGSSCASRDIPDADLLTRQRLIKLWTNFAKYLNPTPEPLEILQNVTWPRVSAESGDLFYLDIDENLEVRNHPKEETYSGWVALYDSLGYDDFDTY